MNPIRQFIKKITKRKEASIIINQQIGIIQPSKVAIENNTIDKFNKVIVIREGVSIDGNEIRWGKIIREDSYSEEKIKALKQVYNMPIVERTVDDKIEFFQEKDFGEVQTLI